jgi:hypothetical protein
MDEDRMDWNRSGPSEMDGFRETAITSTDDEVSLPFVGRWNHLVSDANWEKGRIICQWREALQAADVSAAEYSDEAWSRRVGGVTGQHVGRLRRVFQRFGDEYGKFQGLYWSHFFAALDWDDAEMWLEGAVQNRWSVSQTRRVRWETLGELPNQSPREEDVVHGELDEDFEPALTAAPAPTRHADEVVEEDDAEIEVRADDPDDVSSQSSDWSNEDGDVAARPERIRPFADVPDLPDDLLEAFDAFKLAILTHRSQGWQDVAAADVLTTLDALKALVLAPVDD